MANNEYDGVAIPRKVIPSRTPEARRIAREKEKARNPNLQVERNKRQRESWRKRNPHKRRPDYPATGVFYKGPLISRKEAIKVGKKRYFTGQTCKFGHIDEWLVAGGCLHCRRIHASKKEKWDSLECLKGDIRPRASACEICFKKPDNLLLLDHCHDTGVFRGWLCEKCNFCLGLAGDDPKILDRMARFLRRYGKIKCEEEECITGQLFCGTA